MCIDKEDNPYEQAESEGQFRQIERLAREIWSQHYFPIVGRPQIEYMLDRFQSAEAIARQIENDGFEYYLIPADGGYAGYFAILPDPELRRMMLSKIYVGIEYRRQGIGRRVLDFIESECRQSGYSRIWLTVYRGNKRSIEWYRRRGFRIDGPYIQDIGGGFVMNDFKMVKEI